MPNPSPVPDANGRMNNLWERGCLGLLSIVVTILFLSYQGLVKDLKDTQAQVVILQTMKVNKEDLKETESRLNTKIDAAFSNLVSRSASDKQDIIARLDLYFATLKGK